MSESSRDGGMVFAWCALAGGFLTVHVGRVLYAVSGTEASDFFGFSSFVLSFGTVWYWLWRYALRHRISLPLDIGMFLGAALFLVVPGHVVATERWRSALTLGRAAPGLWWNVPRSARPLLRLEGDLRIASARERGVPPPGNA